MVRFVAAVVVGYLVIAGAVIVLFMAAYPLLGVDRLFEPGSFEATGGWIALSVSVSLVAAMMGGTMCARIAPATAAPVFLAAIVLVLGALTAMPVVTRANPERGGPRPANISVDDARAHVEQPVWVALLSPLIGAIGVLSGAGTRAIRR